MGFIFSLAVFAYILVVCIPCAVSAFFAYRKRSDSNHFWILSAIALAGSILLQSLYVYWPYIDTYSTPVWGMLYSTIIGWHSLVLLTFTVVSSILSSKKPILRGISFGVAISPLIWLIIALSGWIPAVSEIKLTY
jgi:hypothetical protein